MSYSAYGLVHH